MLHATFSVFFSLGSEFSVYPKSSYRVCKGILNKCLGRKKMMFIGCEGEKRHYFYVHLVSGAYWGLAVRFKTRVAKDEFAVFAMLDRVFAHEVLLRCLVRIDQQGNFYYGDRESIGRKRELKLLRASLQEHFLSTHSIYEVPSGMDSSKKDVRHTLKLMRKPVYSKLDNIAQTLRENSQFNENLNGEINREKEKIKSIKSKLIKDYRKTGCVFIIVLILFVSLWMAILR
jgi:hypothetical protein